VKLQQSLVTYVLEGRLRAKAIMNDEVSDVRFQLGEAVEGIITFGFDRFTTAHLFQIQELIIIAVAVHVVDVNDGYRLRWYR
jgi:hypothetical protein